ncbi:MAG: MobC family plasmid mobilization relaxosome protein [Actinomycetota bacterium]|nr:MobC family plasmid mobilization relaxosome protein [Actinomycetota bacterium]
MGKRDRVVAVRLFAAELMAWQDAALGGGRKEVGRWVRETINATISEDDEGAATRPGPAGRPGVELAALARIGNNLNQAVRYAHMRPGDSVVAQELVDAVERVQMELRSLREAL